MALRASTVRPITTPASPACTACTSMFRPTRRVEHLACCITCRYSDLTRPTGRLTRWAEQGDRAEPGWRAGSAARQPGLGFPIGAASGRGHLSVTVARAAD